MRLWRLLLTDLPARRSASCSVRSQYQGFSGIGDSLRKRLPEHNTYHISIFIVKDHTGEIYTLGFL